MLCEGCDQRMTRETVVFIGRRGSRGGSIARPGWYCWTCKASRRVEPAPERGFERGAGPFWRATAAFWHDRSV